MLLAPDTTATTQPHIHGLILIDCWEPDRIESKYKLYDFYHKLLCNLSRFNFECVVNHASELNPNYKDASVLNTVKKYSWQNKLVILDNTQKRHEDQIIVHMIQNSGLRSVPVELQENLLKRFNSVVLHNTQDFVYHVKQTFDQSPTNWLVAGQTWGLCTHTNGLGLQQLAQISTEKQINFYATNWSFCKIDATPLTRDDFDQDLFHWQEIQDWGYRLESNNKYQHA